MKKTLIVAVSFIYCLFAASLFAQNHTFERLRLIQEQNRYIGNSSNDFDGHRFIRLGEYYSWSKDFMERSLICQKILGGSNMKPEFDNAKLHLEQEKPKEKSVFLGIALSALIPGAGEFYAKSYTKAAIFFGVELLSWGAFTYFQVKGDKKTEDFQKYADGNWNVRQYAQWLKDQNFNGSSVINPNEPNPEILRAQINQCEQQNFTHTLPEYYSQQYYELIGKYQNFVAGWADAYINGVWIVTKDNYQSAKTKMFNDYATERGRANDFYSYAGTGIIVVILNHILSAADAAWTVSVYNKRIKVETGFEIKRYLSPFTQRFGNLPSFNMRVSF